MNKTEDAEQCLSWLMTVDELLFWDEVDCADLFPGNDTRERVVIFRLGEEKGQPLSPYAPGEA